MTRTVATILALMCIVSACSNREPEKLEPTNAIPKTTTVSNSPVPDASAQLLIARDYTFKGAGILRLTFPKTWADMTKRIREGAEPVNVIEFAPFSGTDFILMLEVRNLGPGVTKSFDIKSSLMKAGQAELENSLEQSIVTHDIDGPEVSGGYYTVTDKRYVNAQPGPGEYRFLTLGYAKVANMVLKFRLVSNQAPGEEKDEAVEMIRSARFTKQ